MHDRREKPIEQGLGVRCHIDQDSSAIIRTSESQDVPVAFQGVEHAGHGSLVMCMWAPIAPAVIGSPFPSMTAKALSAAWDKP